MRNVSFSLFLVWVMWMKAVSGGYSPVDSFLTLDECKVSKSALLETWVTRTKQADAIPIYVCLPDTINLLVEKSASSDGAQKRE